MNAMLKLGGNSMKKKIGIGIVSIIAITILIGVIVYFTNDLFRMNVEIFFLEMAETTTFEVKGDKLYMNGEINGKTPASLKKVISENPQTKTIVMMDVPGSLNDEANIPMCHWVRKKGLNTHITKNSHIASGGVDFFLAGNKRTMADGAKVGVHSWSDGNGTEAKNLPKDHEYHGMYVEYTKEMLGKEDFYWFTIYAAPANDMLYMTNEDILKYDMVTESIIKNEE